MSATRRGLVARWSSGLVAVGLLVSSCGSPGEGQVQRLDDDAVPYGLLEPSDSTSAGPSEALPGPGPSVLWVRGDRLVPSPTDASCSDPPDEVVERVLEVLAAGPQDDERLGGRSTAIPPESSITLEGLESGTAEVLFDAGTVISADRLPLAVGQIVLAVTSAPGVDSVLLTEPAAPVPIPLPGGALTAEPVTADDYASLLAASARQAADLGCRRP